MAILSKLGRYQDTGLLVMRAGIGFMMIMHGYTKLFAGPDKWTKLGTNMKYFGVHAYPEVWGFMAAASETVGGLFLILGFFFRPSAFFLMCTMIVAAASHLYKGQAFMEASHPIELAFVFFGLFIIGPGVHSVDKG
ncbi:DoxX family protein [Polluticoccus soli]|uniref:DoxX family protein n=1 Tax=Polluticoccus soli TaxID=3034150 RepID=UPI0023E22722|nr:DoxX family protein [Flavipsychrobacter sp. JY13-12]